MTRVRTRRVVRIAGFIAGVAVAALVLMSWQVSSSRPAVGMDLRMVAIAGGELHVSNSGVFLGVTGLKPGGPGSAQRGRVIVSNEGTEELLVQVGAHPSIRELDKLLMVRLRVGGRAVFRGKLGALRSGTNRPFALAARERQTLEASVWLRSSASDGYQGLTTDVSLELEGKPRVP
jgi:hypothetical protein